MRTGDRLSYLAKMTPAVRSWSFHFSPSTQLPRRSLRVLFRGGRRSFLSFGLPTFHRAIMWVILVVIFTARSAEERDDLLCVFHCHVEFIPAKRVSRRVTLR